MKKDEKFYDLYLLLKAIKLSFNCIQKHVFLVSLFPIFLLKVKKTYLLLYLRINITFLCIDKMYEVVTLSLSIRNEWCKSLPVVLMLTSYANFVKKILLL